MGMNECYPNPITFLRHFSSDFLVTLSLCIVVLFGRCALMACTALPESVISIGSGFAL